MDRRFVQAWDDLKRAPRGIQHARTRDLIAALAGACAEDAAAANAIATELLNRERRAPFLGAFLAGLGFLLAIFLVDALLLESPRVMLEAGTVEVILAIVAGVATVASALLYALYRGRFRGRTLFPPRKGRGRAGY